MSSSPVAALSTALASTRRQLFEPFDAARYAALAFCVWLAQLGGAGGMSPGVGGNPVPGGGARPSGPIEAPDSAQLQEVTTTLAPWLPVIAAGVIVAAVVGFVVGAGLLWLQSRGTFMVIHNLAKGESAVVEPWNAHAKPANALFRFRLVVNALGGLVALAAGGVIAWAVWGGLVAGAFAPALVAAAVAAGAIAAGILLVVGILDACSTEFVAPVMYVRRGSVRQGFRDVVGFATTDPGSFLLYLLLRVVVGIGVGVFTVLGTVLTCGFAMLPYVGTLVVLPALVYQRMYALHFMAGQADDLRTLARLVPYETAAERMITEPLPAR